MSPTHRCLSGLCSLWLWAHLCPAQTPSPRTDAYESWRLATEAGAATPADQVDHLPGFEVELIRSALPEEGSWISLAFDPKGRLTIAREKQGLLRLDFQRSPTGTITRTRVTLVEDSLLECRGLLHAFDSLYVSANNSKGFYRLRDTNGDEQFDEKTLLLETAGGVGHGRNHLRLGPDRMIYLMHGDSVEPPREVATASPFRNFAIDELAASALAPAEDKQTGNAHRDPFGHILRYDPRPGVAPPDAPSRFTLVAGGLRNQLDIDFNREGDGFVYDADMEWDAGLPWYRPTRILQIVSGGEYGWRGSPSTFPVYYEDSLPPTLDIGLGSPTGVGFGYKSLFPHPYREAYYIADWSYGRILAVHLAPAGAAYSGKWETFLSGRPLNVTDFTFGPDGAMFFITGGRKTQSGLYRVTFGGSAIRDRAPVAVVVDKNAAALRTLRRELEALHAPGTPGAVEKAWPHLDHEDRWVRFAARVAIENQPPEHWQEKALRSDALTAWLAVARAGHRTSQAALLKRLNSLPLHKMTAREQLLALRIYQLAFHRMGAPGQPAREACLARLDPLLPSPHRFVNHELCRVLTYLGSASALDPILALLDEAQASEDLLHYLHFATRIKSGWDTGKRRRALAALARVEAFRGGRTFPEATTRIRQVLVANLPDAEKSALGALVEPHQPAPPQIPAPPAPEKVVREWKMGDLLPHLAEVVSGRSLQNGKKAFVTSGCAACHRIGKDEATAAGVLGPDLTGIANRFPRHAILLSILHPSLVIADKYRLPEAPNVSAMPPGMINVLNREEVLDLLAFLESAGPAESPPGRE